MRNDRTRITSRLPNMTTIKKKAYTIFTFGWGIVTYYYWFSLGFSFILYKMAFNEDRVFPVMSSSAAHIHLKEGAVLKARHNPIPVPFHFKEPVRQVLWKDVERSIIALIPMSTPTNWCSTMVITAKKNGNPRRTRLPTPLLSVQAWDPPHWVTIPVGTASAIKNKKKPSPICCRQVPLNALRQGIPTIDHLHGQVGKIHVS